MALAASTLATQIETTSPNFSMTALWSALAADLCGLRHIWMWRESKRRRLN
ncbi:hypothetical protein OIHEL45_19446 [Sulfitobacter indolifex HEL-45]|uniref:Uncharacterized protein n=1 Tax=Sulfitobacter indolifex HEL-45 TaxID=391624 RepID=A0ABP2D4L9_9RHOB|nr:hypothetical protein OIHEL45_19446 [Sulfitobacter indolifex HEL-45]